MGRGGGVGGGKGGVQLYKLLLCLKVFGSWMFPLKNCLVPTLLPSFFATRACFLGGHSSLSGARK